MRSNCWLQRAELLERGILAVESRLRSGDGEASERGGMALVEGLKCLVSIVCVGANDCSR